MATELDELLTTLEEALADLEAMDDMVRGRVFDLLDGVDALHRMALSCLGRALEPGEVARLRAHDPAIAWLFDAYAVGVDERAVVEEALGSIRPYIHSHGGDVEVLEVDRGVVRVRMSGACEGCSASAVTLQQGIEEALREGFPGFSHVEVEDDDAPVHPPPGATLLELQPRPE